MKCFYQLLLQANLLCMIAVMMIGSVFAQSTASHLGEGRWLIRHDGRDMLRMSLEKPVDDLIKNVGESRKADLDNQVNIYAKADHDKTSLKPYIDIFATPEGRNILRDGPEDHRHHHGLMFAIKVDGINFWEEDVPESGREIIENGTIRCRNDAYAVVDGTQRRKETIAMRLDWMDRDGKIVIQENRNIAWHSGLIPEATLLDWQTTLTLPDGKDSATLGGNHYHGLGLRFNASMDRSGRFFADTADKTEDVRGSEKLHACRWMAYTAPLEGLPVTVAIFDAPENFRKMFAFTMGGDRPPFAYLSATLNLHRDLFLMKPGVSVRLRYGIALWEGERTKEEVEKAYLIWVNGNTGLTKNFDRRLSGRHAVGAEKVGASRGDIL